MSEFPQMLDRSLRPVRTGQTYLNAVYLMLLLPLGTVSFTFVVTVLSVGAGMLASPFIYSFAPIQIFSWHIDTFLESLVLFAVGIPVMVAGFHLVNLFTALVKPLLKSVLREPKSS